MGQCPLGNVGQLQVLTAVERIVGVILENAQHILCVDIAGVGGILFQRDGDGNCVFQQGVPIGGLGFDDGVGVFLQTFDYDVAVGLAHGDGGKDSGVGFLIGMAGDIVDPFRVIALGNDPCAVGLVLNLELHAVVELGFGGGFRVHIREQLGQVQTEGEYMTVVNEGVIVVAGGALPCQNGGTL